jgi:hypothetical protein
MLSNPIFSSDSQRFLPKRSPWILNTTFLLLCFMLTGCTLGPRQLQGNRFDYNVSIQRSDNQELLLNFVRLRYMEVPCFLQVSSVTSSFEYSLALQTQAQWSKGDLYTQFPLRFISPLFKGAYSESPTVSYSPLSGEKFVSQLLTDITPHRFWFLDRAGWEIDLLLDLLVTKFGKLRNLSQHQLAGPNALEEDRRFLEFSHELRELQRRNNLVLLYHKSEKEEPYDLVLQLRFKNLKEARTIEKLLDTKLKFITLPDGNILSQIFLSSKLGFQQPQDLHLAGPILRIRFRNFIGVLVHLLSGVEVPPWEVAEGIVRQGFTLTSEGPANVGGLTVHCVSAFPENAFVAIKYRGKCFYISDQDFSSKRTFAFVAMLLALQSGETQPSKPVLTLPVGSASIR